METEWMKEQYEDRKQGVLALLQQTQEYYTGIGMEDEALAFETLHDHLEKGLFSIVVVGEFSAGKSTFLNALMGDKYLPSFTNETTATVNFLRHKNAGQEGYGSAVYYKDRNREPQFSDAAPETIERFVSTKSDLHVADEIDRVELFLDSKFLGDGVMLVDSPGLNGVAEGHKEITETQIEKSHACIFMFSAEQPGRKTDFEFLTHLRSKVDTVILVLNKIDVVKPNEQSVEDVMDNLRANYHSFFPDQPFPEIFPVAAYPGLVARSTKQLSYQGKDHHSTEEKQQYLTLSRMEGFEQRLWKFLTQGEKTRQQLYAPVDRVKKLLAIRLKEVNGLKQDLSESADTNSIVLELALLEEEIRQVEESIAEKKQSLFQEINQIVKDTRVLLSSRTRDMKQRLIKDVHEWTDLDQVQQDVEQFNSKIVKQYNLLAQSVYHSFMDEFTELLHGQYREYQQEIEREMSERHEGARFQLQGQLETDSFDFYFGLDEYRTQKESFEQELEKLEGQSNQAMDERLQADGLRSRKLELEEKLDVLKQREQAYLAALGPRPVAGRIAEEYTQKVGRGGLLGSIGDLLIGKKEVTRIDYRTDDQARRDHDILIAKAEQKFNQEADELNLRLQSTADPQKSPEQYRQTLAQLEKLTVKKRMEQEKFEKDFKEQFQRKHATALRKVRNEIEEFIDNMEKEIDELFVKELRSQRSQLCDIAADIIQTNLQQLIQQKQKQLMLRKQQLESSVDEKEILVQQCEQEIESIQRLLENAVSLITELDTMEIDMISAETLQYTAH